MAEPMLLTRKEAAAFVGRKLRSFETRVHPHVAHYRKGREFLYSEADLAAWLERQRVGGPIAAAAPPAHIYQVAGPKSAREQEILSRIRGERKPTKPERKTAEERIAAMPPEQRARFESQSDGSDIGFEDFPPAPVESVSTEDLLARKKAGKATVPELMALKRRGAIRTIQDEPLEMGPRERSKAVEAAKRIRATFLELQPLESFVARIRNDLGRSSGPQFPDVRTLETLRAVQRLLGEQVPSPNEPKNEAAIWAMGELDTAVEMLAGMIGPLRESDQSNERRLAMHIVARFVGRLGPQATAKEELLAAIPVERWQQAISAWHGRERPKRGGARGRVPYNPDKVLHELLALDGKVKNFGDTLDVGLKRLGIPRPKKQ
ncbi:MAG: hypothetical protein WDO69_25070 [Pseudomonadota bacterium]